MAILDFVLHGAWKPMSKSLSSEVAWMLILLILMPTMFVTADWWTLLSNEKEESCVTERKFQGACTNYSVDVESESDTIKATINIVLDNGYSHGSITIGNCQMVGSFSGNQQSFKHVVVGSLDAPISIVATPSEVTLEGKFTNQKKRVCPSPFTVDENGKAKTTIQIRVDNGNIVSLELDPTVKVVQKKYAEGGFKMPVWSWVVLSVVILVIGIVAVGAIIWWRRYKEPKKADSKASNANLKNGNQPTMLSAKATTTAKDKPSKTNKEQKTKKNSENKDKTAKGKKDSKTKNAGKEKLEFKSRNEKKVMESENVKTAKQKELDHVVDKKDLVVIPKQSNKLNAVALTSLVPKKYDALTKTYSLSYSNRTFPIFE